MEHTVQFSASMRSVSSPVCDDCWNIRSHILIHKSALEVVVTLFPVFYKFCYPLSKKLNSENGKKLSMPAIQLTTVIKNQANITNLA